MGAGGRVMPHICPNIPQLMFTRSYALVQCNRATDEDMGCFLRIFRWISDILGWFG